MNTVDIGLLRLFIVVSSMLSPPAESSVMKTAGCPCENPDWASTIWSPDATTARFRMTDCSSPLPG